MDEARKDLFRRLSLGAAFLREIGAFGDGGAATWGEGGAGQA
jgi:hypothetical protein